MSFTSHKPHCIGTNKIYRVTTIVLLILIQGSLKAQQSPTNFLRQLDSISVLNRQRYNKDLQNRPAYFNKTGQQTRPAPGGAIKIPSLNKPLDLGTCLDTSGKISVGKDSLLLYVNASTTTRDGNLLIVGEYSDYSGPVNIAVGLLMKCDTYGNLIWAKNYDSTNHAAHQFLVYYKVKELTDGSIFMVGYAQDNSTINDDIILTRTDPAGNIIWSKDYYSMAWTNGNGSADLFFNYQIKQDAAGGDLYLVSPGPERSFYLIRVNVNTGAIPWSNLYRSNTGGFGYQVTGGIALRLNDIVAISALNVYTAELLIYRINKLTGDTFNTKVLSLASSLSYNKAFENITSVTQLNNGNIAVGGLLREHYLAGLQYRYQAGVVELNSNLDVVKGYAFVNQVEFNSYNVRLTIHPDGNGILNMMYQFGNASSIRYFIQFKDGVLLKERQRESSGEGYPNENEAVQLQDSGELLIQPVGDSATSNARLIFTKLHLSDTSSQCLGQLINITTVEPLNYTDPHFAFTDSTWRFVIQERRTRTLTSTPFTLPAPLPACYQIANCDTLIIKASADSICAQVPFIITTRKNKACGSKVQFVYDTAAVQNFIQLTDSTYQVSFRKAFKGYITGMLAGCTLHSDSVPVTVLVAPLFLNLGPDTTLCPPSSILLNAHNGYATYSWQNGTTDSLLRVTQPGTYYVTVTNACGDTLSDTIVITPHPPIAFDLGTNQQACARQLITLTAPAGFSNYRWSGSNITNNTLPQITSLPTASGWYIVTAEQTAGCQVTDSLFVTVNQTPAIRLGADTSLCTGQQLILNAGAGFTSYQWSTGQQQQQIIITQPGSYSIKATISGCSSYDSLQLLKIYPLPVVDLGPDTILCLGQQLQLSPGQPQPAYLWNTGSTASMVSISQPGAYSVRITSQQGCINRDTIIVNFVATPLFSLGADTTLCKGQFLTLNAASPGATYQWQDGSIAPTYTVGRAGNYYITASIGRCATADTITIAYTAAPLFTLGQDTFICTGRQLQLTPALDTPASLLWQDGSTTPAYILTQPGLYSLTATNQCGRWADSINVTAGTCFIEMPTAFTPNSDGINDVFKLKYPFPLQQFTLSIYNRYGQIIFQTNNPAQGWNGTFEGKPQPQNSFVWTIRYTAINNQANLLKGMVTLIR